MQNRILETAVTYTEVTPHAPHNVIFLTDALSDLQAPQSRRITVLHAVHKKRYDFPPLSPCIAMFVFFSVVIFYTTRDFFKGDSTEPLNWSIIFYSCLPAQF